jgi:hypothetical protein
MGAQLGDQGFAFLMAELQYAPFLGVQQGQLLLGQGDTRGAGHHVPVDVGVGLLAAQRQDIQPFRFEDQPHSFGYGIDHPLQGEVVVQREIPGYLLVMLHRGYQHVTVHGGQTVQKRNGLFAAPHDVVCGEGGVILNQPADEASFGHLSKISLWIESHLVGLGQDAGSI